MIEDGEMLGGGMQAGQYRPVKNRAGNALRLRVDSMRGASLCCNNSNRRKISKAVKAMLQLDAAGEAGLSRGTKKKKDLCSTS